METVEVKNKSSEVYDDKLLDRLKVFIQQNNNVDFKVINLSEEVIIKDLNWNNISDKKSEILNLLLAYQRLLRIMPDSEKDKIELLLKNGIDSAFKIASCSKIIFLKKWEKISPGSMEVGLKIYENALKKRSSVVLQYIDNYQNNEPHLKQAKI